MPLTTPLLSAARTLQHVVGSAKWNPLLYAVVARKKAAVKALLTSYQLTSDVSVFVPRVTEDVLKAAVTWGEPDVFQWLLLYHQVPQRPASR